MPDDSTLALPRHQLPAARTALRAVHDVPRRAGGGAGPLDAGVRLVPQEADVQDAAHAAAEITAPHRTDPDSRPSDLRHRRRQEELGLRALQVPAEVAQLRPLQIGRRKHGDGVHVVLPDDVDHVEIMDFDGKKLVEVDV